MNRDRVEEILSRPYQKVLVRDAESGVITATIAEFPGCVAEGTSPSEAYDNLERIAHSWVESLVSRGLEVPLPKEERDYSGRIALRLPLSLHERAVQLAEEDGVSLNTFLVTAIAERVGVRQANSKAEDFLRRAVHLLEIGLQQSDKPSNLTVDAAVIVSRERKGRSSKARSN